MQIGLYAESQEGVTWDDWRDLALRAEALGCDALATSVHLLPLERPGAWDLELWPVMSALALWTRRIAFGPLVLPATLYHPAQVARAAAAVDRLSGGRFQLGLGSGRHEGEHRAFGLGFPPHEARAGMLAEAVQVIRLLWSGERVSFAGRWYRLEAAQIRPAPARPWLGIGGNSEASLRLAAAQADEWSTTSAPAGELAERLARLDGLAHEAGRSAQAIVHTMMNGVLIGRDGAALERRARRMASLATSLAGQPPRAVVSALASEWGWWVGTPQEVAGQASAVARLGFDRVFFQVYDVADLEAVELVAQAVAPALRAAAGS